MSTQIATLRQVGQHVHDLDRAIAFYRDVLQLRFVARFGQLAFFDLGGVRLLLESGDVGVDASPLYFGVDDVHTTDRTSSSAVSSSTTTLTSSSPMRQASSGRQGTTSGSPSSTTARETRWRCPLAIRPRRRADRVAPLGYRSPGSACAAEQVRGAVPLRPAVAHEDGGVLHLRLIVPSALTADVLEELESSPGSSTSSRTRR